MLRSSCFVDLQGARLLRTMHRAGVSVGGVPREAYGAGAAGPLPCGCEVHQKGDRSFQQVFFCICFGARFTPKVTITFNDNFEPSCCILSGATFTPKTAGSCSFPFGCKVFAKGDLSFQQSFWHLFGCKVHAKGDRVFQLSFWGARFTQQAIFRFMPSEPLLTRILACL